MSRIDPTTGRFVCIPFEEKYPTGRKHCSDCKCWRHVSDFTVHTWLDFAKTIPHKLLAYCRRCASARKRRRDYMRSRRALCGRGRGQYSSKKFLEYLKPYTKHLLVVMNGSRGVAIFINGRRLTESESRAFYRWRVGANRTIMLDTADSWACRFDLPLWEIDAAARIAA
jgi:hypothetical protein